MINIPLGYKQTEVGVIPEDWEVWPLSNVANIRSGIAKNSNSSVSDPILVHYLRVANVQDGFLDLKEMSKIEVARNDLKRYQVLPGDVLMNEGGDRDKLGRGSIWRGEFNPCVHQNHVFVVRCRPTLSPEYLNIWTGATPARRYFLVAGKQTTNLATINKTALGQLPVALPALPEQEAIAEALSDTDALIESLKHLIAKKRRLKQGVMQELLTGKRRLPGFAPVGAGFKPALRDDADIGGNADLERAGFKPAPTDVPHGWEVKKLGDLLARVANGAVYNPTNSFGMPITRIETISNGTIDYSRTGTAEPSAELEKYKLISGDILFSHINSLDHIGKVAQFIGQEDLYHGMNLLLLRANENTDSRFLYLWFTSAPARRKARNLAKQAVSQASINTTELKGLEITIPPLPEQTAIATILSDMDAEITALETKLAKTRSLKQGMMHNLLTGRIRLL